MIKPAPSQRVLLEQFHYDRVSGKLFWKLRMDDGAIAFNGKLAGKEAGTVGGGYRVIKLNGIPYKAHRLVWKIITGSDAGKCIDHIDGNGLNNRFENLRDVTHAQNGWNTKLRDGNIIGFRGVSFNKRLGKWMARIRVDGKEKYLGLFETPELAHAAFVDATSAHRDEYARVA